MSEIGDKVEERREELNRVGKMYVLDLEGTDGLLLATGVEVDDNKVLHYWTPGGHHAIVHPSQWNRAEEKSIETIGKMFSERALAPVANDIYKEMREDGKP